MALTIIRSISTPGAPVLDISAGSLIDVLDFALVTTLGWTKPFSGVNIAAYKQPAGSNGFYLRVDDSTGSNAKVRGCETMADINDVSTAFPNISQIALASGPYWYKSNAAGTTEYVIASDGKGFYFFTQVSTTAQTDWHLYAFKDMDSFKPGDQFATMLWANTTSSATTSAHTATAKVSATGSIAGHYFPRSYTQFGGPVAAGKQDDAYGMAASTYFGFGGTPYPSPVDGGLHMSPVWGSEVNIGRRGLLPGLWGHGHSNTIFNTHDTIVGNADVLGRSFEFFRLAGTASIFLEISDTWGA